MTINVFPPWITSNQVRPDWNNLFSSWASITDDICYRHNEKSPIPVSSDPNALHNCTNVWLELRWFKILAQPSSAIVSLKFVNNKSYMNCSFNTQLKTNLLSLSIKLIHTLITLTVNKRCRYTSSCRIFLFYLGNKITWLRPRQHY